MGFKGFEFIAQNESGGVDSGQADRAPGCRSGWRRNSNGTDGARRGSSAAVVPTSDIIGRMGFLSCRPVIVSSSRLRLEALSRGLELRSLLAPGARATRATVTRARRGKRRLAMQPVDRELIL